MKKCWLIGLLFVLIAAACRPALEESTPAVPKSGEQSVFPDSTPQLDEVPEGAFPNASPEGYPAPVVIPTDTLPEGYPAPPTSAPSFDSYPAGEPIWIIRPVGEQCAEADTAIYADLQDAIAAVAAAGVPVNGAEMIELMVCQACGCPTSAHFRVQISSADLERVTALGWVVQPER